MSGWQPIETAPKDDRKILVFGGNGEIIIAFRVPDYDNDRWAAYGIGFLDPDPTHWMPLPEPPQ